MSVLYRVFIIVTLLLTGLSQQSEAQEPSQTKHSEWSYPKSSKENIRILTYNVRNCRGMDGKTDYDRVAQVILNIDPGFVALQELDSVTTRSNNTDVLKVLAAKCGMNYVYGASIPFQGGKYGIGILSKEKPLRTSFFPLPGTEEKRGFLIAEFEKFILICSHFSLTEADRISSVQTINRQVKGLKKTVFLAGDFNTSPESEAIHLISADWENLSGIHPTFPSTLPKECIDYIFTIRNDNPKLKVIRQEVVPEITASDHRPVFIDVNFK